MRWLDRHGRPLPLEPIFATWRLQSQRRAAATLGRIMQNRQRHALEDRGIVIVRDRSGTRQWEDQD